MDIRSIEQLIDHEHHAWEELIALFRNGSNTYQVLPADSEAAKSTLMGLQVSTRSYLGAVAYETGGILIDEGWIRLLGSGANGIFGSLISWNGLSSSSGRDDSKVLRGETPDADAGDTRALSPSTNIPVLSGMMVVAYDAAGGFFAFNTGRFGSDGHIYYWAPDCLEWESTELTYSEFITWLAEGDLSLFYKTFRWNGWVEDTKQLQPEQIHSYDPPLWSQEGGGDTSRISPAPVLEAWKAAIDATVNQ